jgi:EAL and modified HD-GYP domain-containing signal transduction protein
MPAPEATGQDGQTHDCFVARQPILDGDRQVFGYELLFRSGSGGSFAHGDGNDASLRLIGNTLSVFGLETITAGKKAFINFTRDVLIDGHAFHLPPGRAVVEILETVEPDGEVLDACRRLKQAGYLLALDDYVGDARADAFLGLVDVVKVDFRGIAAGERGGLARRLAPHGVKLLAEKVETWDEWREAVELGYHYFQGYFFCRPETLSRQALAPSRTNYLRLVEELNRGEIDFARVERVIKQEAPLALKLLSYTNSALFGCGGRVTSIKHAAMLLGPVNLRRWAGLTAVTGLCDGKPHELLVTCVIRARFCELLGGCAALGSSAPDLFLIGLLSLIDALLDRSLEEVLAQFAVPAPVREALLDGDSSAGRACDLARACETGDWARIEEAANGLGAPLAEVAEAYRRAVEWGTGTTAALRAGH